MLTGEQLVNHGLQCIEDIKVFSGPGSYALQKRTQHLVS